MTLDERLQRIVEEWVAAAGRGHDLPATDLCRLCPDLLPEAERQIALLRQSSARPVPSTSATRSDHAGTDTRESPGQHPPGWADATGTVLGGFRLHRLLGEGGMGQVYEAEDLALGRRAAVKLMRAQLLLSEEARARFLREAKAVAAINHEHVVPLFQVGEANGTPFIVMPLLAGQTLASRLEQGPLPSAEVARVGRETAAGLAAVHATGLVHRDVKPGNLWLEAGSNRVKLLDFGLARSLESNKGDLTAPGRLLGSPGYMAPEQISHTSVDAKADLFALGATLYHAATGEPPFKGDTLPAILLAVSQHHPPSPHKLNPDISPALSATIMQLLAKEPGQRPPTADAVARALEPSPQRDSNRKRRAGRAIGAAALVSLAALVAGQIVFRFDNNGKKTELSVPDGSQVKVQRDGSIDVRLPPGVEPPPIPAAARAEACELLLDVDRAEFLSWHSGLKKKSLRPEHVSVRGIGDGLRFTAIAVAEVPGAASAAVVDRRYDDADATKECLGIFRMGFRPVASAGYAHDGADYYTCIWIKDKPAPEYSCSSQTLTSPREMAAYLDDIARRAEQPVHLSLGRRADGGRHYTVATRPGTPGLLWGAKVELTQAEFDREHEGWTARGYRLDFVSVSDGPSLHAIWLHPKDGSKSDFDLALSREELARKVEDSRKQGVRPHAVSVYEGVGGLKHAVVWQRGP